MLQAIPLPEDGPGESADTAAHPASERHSFTMRFTSSPRGAQLARRLAVKRLERWGQPPESDTSCTVALLVGELTANAVCHGRVPGREFALALSYDISTGLLRIEVADASPVRPPAHPALVDLETESGRGLFLVDLLADRWGSEPRNPIGKSVWAELTAASC